MEALKKLECMTFWAEICMAGDFNQAQQIIRKLASNKGMCVTIRKENTYIPKVKKTVL